MFDWFFLLIKTWYTLSTPHFPTIKSMYQDHVTDIFLNKMAAEVDVRLYNIVILGIAFMLLFTAFQTASMAEV